MPAPKAIANRDAKASDRSQILDAAQRAIRFACCCLTLLALLAPHPSRADSAEPSPSPQPLQSEQQTAFVFPDATQALVLPAKIVNGQVIVRLQVGERGLDLVLDSGSPTNILDPDVYGSLRLGDDKSEPGVIANAQVGGAQVNGLTFDAAPYFRRIDANTTVVGILGYGFFRNAVVKVDYDQSSVELIEPEHFEPPKSASFEIPVDLSTRIPLTHASVGAASGDRFVIDTGATTDVVFAQFSNQYPAEFSADHVLHDSDSYRYLRRYFPTCGSSEHVPFSVSGISVGNAAVRDWVVWKPDDKSCFQRTWDGLIGYDFLRLFAVYFDYPRSRVLLEPNDLYKSANNTQQP